jgi:hypothetical protein
MNLEFPGMDIIFLTNADDLAVAITADPKRKDGIVAMQRIKENGFEMSTTKTNILHCCRKHICEIPNFVVGDKTEVP